MICPNFNIKEVCDGFNEVITALGGRAMTEDEFKSSELRNQRTGLDYSAMEAAYKIYHRNNGNMPDLAPNGERSILFQTLLDHFNGNRAEAIRAKSKVYSDNFLKWFGWWITTSINYSPTTQFNIVDDPDQTSAKILKEIFNNNDNVYNAADVLIKFKTILPKYTSEFYHFDLIDFLGDVVEHWKITQPTLFENLNNVKVKFSNKIPKDELGHYDPKTHSIYILSDLSSDLKLRAFLHELIHAIVYSDLADSPLYDDIQLLINKINTDDQYKDLRGFYGLKDPHEFVSEFFTNHRFIAALIDAPAINDTSVFSNLFQQVSSFILKTLFRLGIIKDSSEYNSLYNSSLYKQLLPQMYQILGNEALFGKNLRFYLEDNVSKVVDENGEPLVVYHHTDNPNLTEFSTDFDNYFSKDGGTKEAIFFDQNETGTLNRKYDIPVFLNIKDLREYNETKEQLHQRGATYRQVVNESAAANNIDGGVHMKDFDDNKMEHQSIWIVHNPNQIKSATDNNGDFSTQNNIYRFQDTDQSQQNTEVSTFNVQNDLPTTSEQLIDGQTVSSNDVIYDLLNNPSISSYQKAILKLLSKLNIPIRFTQDLGEYAGTTVVDDNNKSVIALNAKYFQNVPKAKAVRALIHELLHAKVLHILDNPVTSIQKDFASTTQYVYDLFVKKLNELGVSFEIPVEVRYALLSKDEFSAEFIASEYVRQQLFNIAKTLDKKNNRRFVNSLKRLLNKATAAIFDKEFFKTDPDLVKELDKYEKDFLAYLNGTQEESRQNLTKKELDLLYDSISDSEIEFMLESDAIEYLRKVQKVNLKILDNLNPITALSERIRAGSRSQNIIDDLNLRLQSIYTRSLDAATKSSAIDYTKKQIEAFSNSQVPKYLAITSLLSYIEDNLQNEVNAIVAVASDTATVVSETELQYLTKDTLNIYRSILNRIKEQLSEDFYKKQLVDEYNNSGLSDKISLDDMLALDANIEEMGKIIDRGIIASRAVTKRIGINIVSKVGNEVNSPTIQSHIEDYMLDNQFDDVYGLWRWLGSSEMSENETVRAITHIISTATKNAYKEAKTVTSEGLLLLSKLKKGQHMTDLYERYKNGGSTGYLIRDLNFGEFYRAYDEQLIKINKMLGLPLDNRVAPDDEALRIKFNALRNEWLSKNAHRKYVNGYYDAWNAVPTFVKQRLQMYNDQIDQILERNNIKDQAGFPDYSKLPESEYDQLRRLIIGKRALRSQFDEFGRKKVKGDVDYDIYVSLKQLDEKLDKLYQEISGKPKETRVQFAIDEWTQARNAVIEKCGGTEEYQKWINGEENSFDGETMKKWDLYNSRIDFKRDKNGRAILFEEISNLLQNLDKTVDYGPEYNALKEEIDDILSTFRNEMGEVDIERMPDSTLNNLTNKETGLIPKAAAIKARILRTNPRINSLSKQKRRLFNQYLVYVETERFGILKSKIKKALAQRYSDDEDPFAYTDAVEAALGKYGTSYFDGEFSHFTPYSFLTKAQAKDMPQYMILMPNYNWIERSRTTYLNTQWEGEKYEASVVPFRLKYDNSTQYAKIIGPLKDLYEYAHRTLKQSNEMQTNRQFADNYLLPQIPAGAIERILSARWAKKIQVIRDLILEKLGFQIGIPIQDITETGTTAAVDQPETSVIPDEDISFANKEEERFSDKTTQQKTKLLRYYSNDEEFHILPQYYTRKLTDPSIIDRNLIHILGNYYLQSLLYDKRSKIKDECETLLDLIAQQKFSGGNSGLQSNTYKEARGQMNRRIYDERRSITSGFQWSTTASTLRNYTTAVNLGAKPSIAYTALLSTLYKFQEGALGGADYSFWDCIKAEGHMVLDIFKGYKIPFQISSPNTNQKNVPFKTSSKRTAIAEYYGLAEQYENSLKHLQHNRLFRIIEDHSIFGLMTMSDYIAKTTIAEGILRSFRYVDGEFITHQLIENRRLAYGEDVYKQKLKEYKKAKSLYQLFKNENGKLVVDDQYKEAEQKAYDLIAATIQNTSQMMDGLPTAEQRNAASSNMLGMLFFIHRNYLSVLAQRYWRKPVYSYETENYINGYHRQSIGFIAEMLRNHMWVGALMSGAIGLSIGGGLGATITAGMGIGYAMYQKSQDKKNNIEREKKSIKDTIKSYYGKNLSSQQEYIESLHKQRGLRQITAELALHYILFDLFLSALFFPFADDDDNKDNLLVQLTAYCLRKAELETFNQYRLSDLKNTLQSVSASQSVMDRVEGVFNSAAYTLFPNANMISQFGLWDAIENQYDKDRIQSGAYEDWNRGSRFLWRLVPYSNFFHETSNKVNPTNPDWGGRSVFETRRYFENKVLHVKHDQQEKASKKKKSNLKKSNLKKSK